MTKYKARCIAKVAFLSFAAGVLVWAATMFWVTIDSVVAGEAVEYQYDPSQLGLALGVVCALALAGGLSIEQRRVRRERYDRMAGRLGHHLVKKT